MPNILKRPMFRKGGSTADGVGITSGLSTRQNYSEAGVAKNLEYDIKKGYSIEDLQNAGLFRTGGKETTPQTTTSNTQTSYDPLSDPSFDLIRNRYQELLPTRETSLQDLVTALGATAPEDATKLQTIGQVLSKAGTTAAGLRQQREATAEGFKSGALTEVLKNMNAEDKDQLIRRAKIFARLNNIPEDQAVNLFLSKLLETGGSDYLKDYSPEVRSRQIGEKLAEDGFTSPGSFQEQITAGNIWQLWESQQLPQQVQETLSATTYPNDLVVDPESGTAEFNPDKKGINQSRYVPNKSYVNPSDGGVYLYEGNGQFKKIYP
jgi:hypothetical protein